MLLLFKEINYCHAEGKEKDGNTQLSRPQEQEGLMSSLSNIPERAKWSSVHTKAKLPKDVSESVLQNKCQ